MATTTRMTTMHTAAATTVTSVGGSVGESTDECVDGPVGGVTEATGQLLGSKVLITTGHVVSTYSCVEVTTMGGVEVTQEVRREGTSTAGCAM